MPLTGKTNQLQKKKSSRNNWTGMDLKFIGFPALQDPVFQFITTMDLSRRSNQFFYFFGF